MKKIAFLYIIFFLLYSHAKPQDYFINFTASGASSNVDSVRVENLMQDTLITLKGTEILRLKLIYFSEDDTGQTNSKISISPNPVTEGCMIRFFAKTSGTILINIYDSTGARIAQTQNTLEVAEHYYYIKGLSYGKYLLEINSQDYAYSDTLISNSTNLYQSISILYRGKKSNFFIPQEYFYARTEQVLPFRFNDALKITAYAGRHKKIVVLRPNEESTTVNLFFQNCTDANGNDYPVVKIGDQYWMASNLMTTKYNDYTEIQLVSDSNTWSKLESPAYCWYKNEFSETGTVYGALYNWYAIDTISNNNKNICPIGWHIPNSYDWKSLYDYLGGNNVAGGKIKDRGFDYWKIPNTAATNESGFTALPAGNRFAGGAYGNLGQRAHFWSYNEYYAVYAWSNLLFFSPNDILRNEHLKRYGFSIRCVKD
ncbi:MAG: FISUMP domain-containing protein [Bacteroidales bacterium]|nr:FISUMP domain-containing protein [Bacteroidales bacterium]